MSSTWPTITNKRRFLGRTLRASGLLRLLEIAARRPCLAVLTYHRIADPATTPYYSHVCSGPPDVFEQQVRAIRDRFRTVTLEEVVKRAGDGFRFDEPTALITFDDGYRDNFEAAFPILQSLRVPAAFFLPTAFFFERKRLFWWDRLAAAVNRAKVSAIVLERPEPLTVDLPTATKAAAIALLIAIHRRHHLEGEAEADFLDHLDERAGLFNDDKDAAAEAEALFMTVEQIEQLAGSGMSIGSHTHNHAELARLPESVQRDELARSKAILEVKLGRGVDAVAYPYGWPGAVAPLTQRLARETRYRIAFDAVEGLNLQHQTNPFAIKRFNVSANDPTTLLRSRLALHQHFGRSIL